MYLVFENVIIRIACIIFRDFMSLVKHDQILSLFDQAQGRSPGGSRGNRCSPPHPFVNKEV